MTGLCLDTFLDSLAETPSKPDPDFARRLDGVLRSIDVAELGAGKSLAVREVQRMLVQHLRHQASRGAPDWETAPSVILIAGLHRTGSTLLHRALSQCEAAEFLTYAESLWPYEEGDVREAGAEMQLKMMQFRSPRLLELHPMSPREPEECLGLLDIAAISDRTRFILPSIDADIAIGPDPAVAVAEYKRMLVHLKPDAKVLVLKAPVHLDHLPQLAEHFPGLYVVWLHRNVTESMDSFLRLLCEIRKVGSDSPLTDRERSWWDLLWGHRLNMAARWARSHPDRIIDVASADLFDDPRRVVHQLCERLPLVPPSGAFQLMTRPEQQDVRRSSGRDRDLGTPIEEYLDYRSTRILRRP